MFRNWIDEGDRDEHNGILRDLSRKCLPAREWIKKNVGPIVHFHAERDGRRKMWQDLFKAVPEAKTFLFSYLGKLEKEIEKEEKATVATVSELTPEEQYKVLKEYWEWTAGLLPFADYWEHNDVSAGKSFFADDNAYLASGGEEAIVKFFEDTDDGKSTLKVLKALKGKFPEHEAEIEKMDARMLNRRQNEKD